jgi:hypothetical protein
MNVYIWEMADEVSGNYHSGGGLLVVATSEFRARELANSTGNIKLGEDEKVDVVIPSFETEEERVIVFPDAGCC